MGKGMWIMIKFGLIAMVVTAIVSVCVGFGAELAKHAPRELGPGAPTVTCEPLTPTPTSTPTTGGR